MKKTKTKFGTQSEKLDGLLVDVFIATSRINKPEEASIFLSGLLTKQELLFLARRLRIAILLASGYSYSTIQRSLSTSSTTVARVNEWMEIKGDGARLAMKRLGELGQIQKILASVDKELDKNNSTNNHKGTREKYSECFWPVDLVAAIIKGIGEPDDH